MKKTILVTGASSGIGAAASEYLSEQGYFVVLVARNEDRLHQISEKLNGESLTQSILKIFLQNVGTTKSD